MRPASQLLTIVLLGLALGACGTKGPLVVAPKPAPTPPATATPVQPDHNKPANANPR